MKENRSDPVRVLIVESQPVVGEGLRAALAEAKGIEVVGLAGTGEIGVALTGTLKPDVVVMDVELPGMDGLEATEVLWKRWPEIMVLLLSVHENAAFIARATQAGACGYLFKDAPVERIVESVRAVAAAKADMASRGATGGVRTVPIQRSATAPKLSEHEERVLLLVVSEKSNQEIAQTLGIKISLVRSRRDTIKQKLGIRTTAGLTKYAIAIGLVSENEEDAETEG